MNKFRRKLLKETSIEVSILHDRVFSLKEQEEDALENMPDNLAGSDAVLDMEEKIDAMDEACTLLSEAASKIEEAIA